MRGILHAGEVGGIVQGGGELRDAAAHGLARVAVDDDAGFHIALRGTAWAGVAVEGEGLTRVDHGTVDLLGHQADIGAGGPGEAAGGELGHGLIEGGLLCHFRGEVCGVRLVIGIPFAVVLAAHTVLEALEGLLPVDDGAIHRGRDLLVVAAEGNFGVGAGHLGALHALLEKLTGAVFIHLEAQLAVFGGDGDKLGNLRLAQGAGGVVLALEG